MGHAVAQKSNNVIGIAALAAMLGAVAALLFTPKSGQEMRSEIKDRANRTKDMTKDKMEAAKSKLSEAKTKAHDKIDDTKSKARDKVSDTADRLADSDALDEYGRM